MMSFSVKAKISQKFWNSNLESNFSFKLKQKLFRIYYGILKDYEWLYRMFLSIIPIIKKVMRIVLFHSHFKKHETEDCTKEKEMRGRIISSNYAIDFLLFILFHKAPIYNKTYMIAKAYESLRDVYYKDYTWICCLILKNCDSSINMCFSGVHSISYVPS